MAAIDSKRVEELVAQRQQLVAHIQQIDEELEALRNRPALSWLYSRIQATVADSSTAADSSPKAKTFRVSSQVVSESGRGSDDAHESKFALKADVERTEKNFRWLVDVVKSVAPYVEAPSSLDSSADLQTYLNAALEFRPVREHPDVQLFLKADEQTLSSAESPKDSRYNVNRPLSKADMFLPPHFLYTIGVKSIRYLEDKIFSMKGGQLATMESVNIDAAQTQSLYVVSKLRIADILWEHRRALPVARLAELTGTLAPFLYRVLRFVSQCGIFEVQDDGERLISLNEAARHLVSVHPYSAKSGSTIMQEEHHDSLRGLMHTLTTGEIAFDHIYGTDIWSYFKSHPSKNREFDSFMSEVNALPNAVLPEDFDFSRFETICDVGGGQGEFLGAILAKTPSISGVLFDQPQVLSDDIRDRWRSRSEAMGLKTPMKLVAGNFFEDELPKANAYVLRMILHDWNEERSVTLLSNIARSMGDDPKARILVVDDVMVTDGTDPMARIVAGEDVIMMCCTGGIERTREEFEHIFDASGLELVQITSTRGMYSVLEARKKQA